MTKDERIELIDAIAKNVPQYLAHIETSNGIEDCLVLKEEDVRKVIRGFVSENDMKAQPNWEAECKRISERRDCLLKHVEELEHIINTKCSDYDRLRLIVSHIETLTGRKFE